MDFRRKEPSKIVSHSTPSNFFWTDDRSVQANANEIGVKRARKETFITKRGVLTFPFLKFITDLFIFRDGELVIIRHERESICASLWLPFVLRNGNREGRKFGSTLNLLNFHSHFLNIQFFSCLEKVFIIFKTFCFLLMHKLFREVSKHRDGSK